MSIKDGIVSLPPLRFFPPSASTQTVGGHAADGAVQPAIRHNQISSTKCKDTATGGKDTSYVCRHPANLALAQARLGFLPHAPFEPIRGVF